MIEKLVAANLLALALAAACACARPTGWECDVRRYGNRVTVNECHRVGH